MRALRFLVGYLILALVAAALLLVDIWPWHPSSWHTWLLYVALALPVQIVGEWIGEKALTNPLSKSVDRATAKSSFSWLRIAYLLAIAIFALGVFAIVQLLRS